MDARGTGIARLAALVAISASLASAHYAWTYFPGRSAPFRPIPAHFDLNALPNKTAYYFLPDQGPSSFMPGDSFAAVTSEIRAAAEHWDGVATSDVRLKFGGYGGSAAQSAPGIDLVFDDDVPPGVLAQTSVWRQEDLSAVAGGAAFVPILRSRIYFPRDLAGRQQASFTDKFFTTLVHEFGHSLGLQHSMTSAAMSTLVTRATTKAKPLAADDIAGISSLYPTPDVAVTTGVINGRVTLNGAGVNLASVVAVSAAGIAVSEMTNPDGTFQIDGIPPGDYYVYVHPLPKAVPGESAPANIEAPKDSQTNPFPANTGFVTQFFPGTRDWTQAFTVSVAAGGAVNNVNFSVQASGGPALSNMQTYGYGGPGGQVPLASPSLAGGRRYYLSFYADGALNGTQLAAGLNVRILGSAATIEPGSIGYFAPQFVLMIVNTPPVSSTAPVTLVVTTNSDMYVLPAAFFIVPAPAPSITSVSGFTDGLGNATVNVAGTNLNAETRVMFEGAQGRFMGANADGSLTVAAPPASGNYRSSVVALNTDGQTSTQALGSALPPAFTYTAPDNPVMSVTPSVIPAGIDTMIEISGFGGALFVDGQVAIGFGSTDILVKRAWVVDRNLIRANISVNPAAATSSTPVTVVSGLQLMSLKTYLQIQPVNPKSMALRSPVVSQDTGAAGVSQGHVAIISTQGLPQNLAGWTLTIHDAPTSFLVGGGNQIYFTVPVNAPVGPVIVKLISPLGDNVAPVVMQVDGPPPVLLAASVGGQPLDAARQAHAGDVVVLTVAGLAEPNGSVPVASMVRVKVGGVDHVASSVTDLGGGAYAVQFTISPLVPFGPQQAVSVGVGTRFSSGFTIGIRG